MKILVWNSPFISQGNIFFFKNCFIKTLIPQANTLCKAGHNVDVIITDSTVDAVEFLDVRAKKIFISGEDVFEMLDGMYDPNSNFYKNDQFKFNKISNVLYKKLNNHYDAILLWETPVPFLEKMYPEALIAHQMPGVFCRPPYPHLITFDVTGLYKKGTIYNSWKDIVTYDTHHGTAYEFINICYSIFSKLNVFSDKIDKARSKYHKIHLLPLQVSAHYAFGVDSGYHSQTELLFDVSRTIPRDEGIFVTQYITPNTSDKILSGPVVRLLNSRYSNIIYDPLFNEIDSVSQYLVPFVDGIISVSSSLLFQSMLWNKNIKVFTDSFMSPYADENIFSSKLDIKKAHTNTINFFIDKHQVLASKLEEPIFMTRFLEELVEKKKKGKTGIDTFCCFSDIDDNYSENLLNSFRYNRSRKSLKSFFPKVIEKDIQLDKIDKNIKNNDFEIISFDIFDTLISRVIEKPADLYLFLQEICFKESNGIIGNFALFRTQAEIESRKLFESEETSLDFIYTYIEEKFHLDRELLKKMKQHELNLELKFSVPHPLGNKIYKIAQDLGKRIILVTDMYLPQVFIEKLLNENGYSNYEKLYVSCEIGCSKRKGDIYRYIIEDLEIAPEKILHFGDNKKNDIENSTKNKLNSYYLCNAITRLRINKNYYEIFSPKKATNKARSACVGLIALKAFSATTPDYEKNSLFLGSTHMLGYAGLGPILLSYVLWLIRRANEIGVKKLYFLSREGWLIKEIYDIVAPYFNGAPESVYLYASRRALNMATLNTEADIIAIASLPYVNGSSISELIKSRFGIEYNQFCDTDLEQKIEYSVEGRLRFVQMCLKYKEAIFAKAETERNGYITYLSSLGCYDEKEIAIVDLGWKARMQTKLHKILGKKIIGFYYGTISEFEYSLTLGDNVHAFCTEGADTSSSNLLINNRKLFELLICSDDMSLEYFSLNDGKPVPNFIDEENYYERKSFISSIHAGCIDFSRDFVRYFSDFLKTMFITPEFSTRVMESFIKKPMPLDIELLKNILFADAVGGLKKSSAMDFFNIKKKVPPTETASKKINEPKVIENKPTVVRKIEKYIFTKLLSSRKRNKYLKDRQGFFEDSNHSILHWWYRKF